VANFARKSLKSQDFCDLSVTPFLPHILFTAAIGPGEVNPWGEIADEAPGASGEVADEAPGKLFHVISC